MGTIVPSGVKLNPWCGKNVSSLQKLVVEMTVILCTCTFPLNAGLWLHFIYYQLNSIIDLMQILIVWWMEQPKCVFLHKLRNFCDVDGKMHLLSDCIFYRKQRDGWYNIFLIWISSWALGRKFRSRIIHEVLTQLHELCDEFYECFIGSSRDEKRKYVFPGSALYDPERCTFRF